MFSIDPKEVQHYFCLADPRGVKLCGFEAESFPSRQLRDKTFYWKRKIIIPEIFGSITSKRSFDVSLHFGSLLAVIFYLKKDISKIAIDTIFFKQNNEGLITFKNLIISTLPIV